MSSLSQETKEGIFIVDNTLWQLVYFKEFQCRNCKKSFHFSDCGWISVEPDIYRCRMPIDADFPIIL